MTICHVYYGGMLVGAIKIQENSLVDYAKAYYKKSLYKIGFGWEG